MTDVNIPGPSGVGGIDGAPGSSQSGTPGGPGGDATAINTGNGLDTTNTAEATGGTGGVGGSGANSLVGAGGNAAAGGAGGSGTANTNVTLSTATSLDSKATATGANGGNAGHYGISQIGLGSGLGAAAGAGGSATAAASSSNSSGPAGATANATAGIGGDAFGAGGAAGAGGVASGTTATASGSSAYASVTQTGGSGGRGYGFSSGGAGASSTLINAVSGQTTGGNLVLRQTAVSGQGGYSDSGLTGLGGSATSSLTFDDTANSTQAASFRGYVKARAYGGGGRRTGGVGSPGTPATALGNLTGGHYVYSSVLAYGGAGGGVGSGAGTPGVGGAATSSSYATSTTNGADRARSRAGATGGSGGSVVSGLGGLGSGGAGGTASAVASAVASAEANPGIVFATAFAIGGAGGFGSGSGQFGGAGGAASATASASGYAANVSAFQIGGAGGLGFNGASSGAGANSTMINAVSGRTSGGPLNLKQDSSGGNGSLGGAAISDLTFNDVVANPVHAQSVTGVSNATGGSGATGGAATASINLTGANAVTASVTAAGGSAGSAGPGGNANGTAIATAIGAAPSSTASAIASATGGRGLTQGTGTANASATTANGQPAQAHVSAGGSSGSAHGTANTVGTGLVSGLSVVAGASGDGTVTTDSEVNLTGTHFGFAGLSDGAFGFAAGLPDASFVHSVLTANPDINAKLGAPASSVAGQGVLGAFAASGTTGTQDDTSTIAWTLNATGLSGDLVLGLFGGLTSTGSFSSLDFNVVVGSITVFDQPFGSLSSAQSFFTNGVIDLGSFTAAPGLTIDVNLTLTTSTTGTGFGGEFLLGTTGMVCFCAGTLIRTPGGEVRVETLRPGDRVTTLNGEARRIIWVGTGRVMVARGRRSAATPVIVRKGALAENVPHHDLHVTKGHAFYLDGVLVPVEFLVNHRSILWDDWAQEVTIYHIELKGHDVLLANGAPAETYRDDGNRWLFHTENPGWCLPPQAPCAPVHTGGPIVDAIWLRLLKRAGPRKQLPLTDDPDLHLMVDGKRLNPLEHVSDHYVLRLAKRPHNVRIVSRTAVPQELGLARDARSLGVAVKQIVVAQARRQWMLDADAELLADGYHAFEAENGIRWTNGDAAVPKVLFEEMERTAMLILHLGATTQYLDDGTAARAA